MLSEEKYIRAVSVRAVLRCGSSTPRRARKFNRAFTLTELLIVIGIIALLAALLFPVFGAARKASRLTVCSSNLHQIGLATAMYMQDYDHAYPSALNPWDRTYPLSADYLTAEERERVDDYPLFSDALQPYCKSREVFHCPADTGYVKADIEAGNVAVKPSAYAFFGASYNFVQLLNGEREGCANEPSVLVYGWDGYDHWHADEEVKYEQKSRNALYFDWHTRFIPLSEFKIGYHCGRL